MVEHIRVRAEGHNIRRGIYRDFPTRYRDRYGNRVVVDFEMIDVQRDGRPEPWFTERRSNGVRINTGNGLLPVPAEPRLDANRFERLLPYAVALGVEDAWTKKFTLAVGAAAGGGGR